MRLGHVTWADASTFSTDQVNSVSDNCFAMTEVLFDINGMGGHQFTVMETGYLDPFFPVYASEHMHVNILSFCRLKISTLSVRPQSTASTSTNSTFILVLAKNRSLNRTNAPGVFVLAYRKRTRRASSSRDSRKRGRHASSFSSSQTLSTGELLFEFAYL